eukprot:5933537-Prymnesium_polylepis.1
MIDEWSARRPLAGSQPVKQGSRSGSGSGQADCGVPRTGARWRWVRWSWRVSWGTWCLPHR